MNKYMICLGPVLLAEALIYFLGLTFLPAIPEISDWRVQLFEVLHYALAALLGVLVGREFASLWLAVGLGAAYWLIWRMALFVVGTSYYALSGTLPAGYFWPAISGFALSLIVFSPIAIFLAWIGGLAGRRFLHASRQ